MVLFPEDQEREKQERERRAKSATAREEYERSRYREKGERYCFVSSSHSLDLPPVDAARLIYLSTYMRYDHYLWTNSRSVAPMKKADLHQILDVSNDTANRFWRNVKSKYLFEDLDGSLYLDTQWFIRGRLRAKKFSEYQQFYDLAVRRLYQTATPGSLKKIGYIYDMLPFISREFNILAANPLETDLDKVIPLSITQFCNLTGLTRSNIHRVLKQLCEIRFKTNRRSERFCSVVYNGSDLESAKIVINPSVLFVGSNINRVKVYSLFFKD